MSPVNRSTESRRLEDELSKAAAWITSADGILVTAGAGMGVDSGLPDFRGDHGFWKAYPALAQAKLRFVDIACPQAFENAPRRAWGFYGHRLKLYRSTTPHAGFHLLQRWGERAANGLFVFTSNVDGQFQKAGVHPARIVECHGSIHHLQCCEPCTPNIWSADDLQVDVDDARCHLEGELPSCPACGKLARPNILMFGDARWNVDRTDAQMEALSAWRQKCRQPVVIELGAGESIPTVRDFGEGLGVRLIRVNPIETEASSAIRVSLQLTALDALRAIDRQLADG
jgi:NAD-dependent SIR2 family protein deacetylase